jgi:hypothetical protein
MVALLTMQHQPAAAGNAEQPSGHQGRPMSAQQAFERERARLHGGGPLGGLARALAAFGGRQVARTPAALAGRPARHMHGLIEHGAVILDSRRTPIGRRWVDHLVVAPSGVYVVEDRPWRGQAAVSGEWLFVDGRAKSGVPEAVRRTAEAVQLALGDELRSAGLGVTPVLCLPQAAETWRPLSVNGVAVFTARGLPRYVRQAEQLLGRDTILRLALAADRLLEHEPPPRAS